MDKNIEERKFTVRNDYAFKKYLVQKPTKTYWQNFYQ